MKVVLAGAEKGTYRNVLKDNNVQSVAMNLTHFAVPKRKELEIKEHFGTEDVYLYTSDDDSDIDGFDNFIRQHGGNITSVIGRPDYNGEWLGDKYIPIWNDPEDTERLAHLCERYGRVAISDRAITSSTTKRIKQLKQRWNAFMIVITGKVDIIESVDWDVAIVTSWKSVVRYGETQIWDGHGLRRYPAAKKQQVRQKHRNDITRLGVDFDAVMEDDVKEVAKMAVLSWLEWEKRTYDTPSSAAYDLSGVDLDEWSEHLPEGGIATTSPDSEKHTNTVSNSNTIATYAPESRHESDRELLPVFGIDKVLSTEAKRGANGDETYDLRPHEEGVVALNSKSVRQCDSCYLAPRCPRFEEHMDCAYDLPMELKSKSQLQSLLTAMVEMQASRVMFAKFAEDVEGQGIDAELSAEMDRLFRLVKDFKDIQDTRDVFRMEVEAKGSGGVLSKIFGSDIADKANQLPTPMTANELDQAIIEADILDDPPVDT